MREINVGLLGCGTVGLGVAKLLIEQKGLLISKIGAVLNLKRVADIDTKKAGLIKFDDNVFISDAMKVVDDSEIDIIVETIGGEKIAKDLILKALNNGKHVVTANKALLANHGNSIIRQAFENGVEIAFEASVGGCMPIIKSLRESLVCNRIQSMTGILNGTCNYIFSKITDDKISFKEALSEAQASGIAEADPTLDIQGIDTAHKLAILIALAYGTNINFKDIYIEGITKITSHDLLFADQFGYKIKLLAITKDRQDKIEARVHPTMIPCDNILSNVDGTLNAINISGNVVGDMLLYGNGAGMMPTASAVVSDIVDIARNMLSNTKGRVPLLSFLMDNIRNIPIMPIEDIMTHYYFRFLVLDKPGVLSKISGILGDHNISIKSVHQKGRRLNGFVPIVMLTHIAKEADVNFAMIEISDLNVVTDSPVIIRIEDDNIED